MVNLQRSLLQLYFAEEVYRNRGPTRNSVRRAKQRMHKRAKLGQPFHANTALLFPQFEYTDFHALTALDLNADGTRLTSASSLKGPEKKSQTSGSAHQGIRGV